MSIMSAASHCFSVCPVPAKKQRVTFDPEVRPSSSSSPPPLLLANHPPIVNEKDIVDIEVHFEAKSILKNYHDDDKPYDSLCNLLIDIPPPPSNDLLTLDILQETVFTPKKNRFAKLIEEENETSFFEEDLISKKEATVLESTNNELEEDFTCSNFQGSFANINELEDIHFDMVRKAEIFESSLPIEQDIKQSYIEHEDYSFNLEDEVSTVIENVLIAETGDQILSTHGSNLSEDIKVECNPEPGDHEAADDLQIHDNLSDDTEHMEENLEEDLPSAQQEPHTRLESTDHEESIPIKHDFDINSLIHREDDIIYANTLMESELLLGDETPLTNETLFTSNTDLSLPSQFISTSPTNIVSNEICDKLERKKERLKISYETSIEIGEQVLSLDEEIIQNYNNKLENSNISVDLNANTQNFDLNSSSSDKNIVETVTIKFDRKNRNKSGKRRHKKYSRSNHRSICVDPDSLIAEQDQREAEARARFKRFIAKMSKQVEETTNLNYAGEPESLEPHMRDSIKESQILIWIYNMIDEAARVDFEFFLKDGCILCKLMNRIAPGCIPEEEITWEGARSKQKNIANFLKQAEKYGVPKAKLFFPEDILHLRHIPRVTRCIYALAKIAQEDSSLGEDTPQLGDEPSFLKEASTKVVIPGHRDTKDVLAQLTASKDDEKSKKLVKHSLYK